MCSRLGCPFQGIGRPNDDGFIRILIIGATGMTGTAVLSAALTCIWFKITVFTRRMGGPVMEDLLKKPLARVVEGDMFNYESVLEAVTGNDAVFFSTTYWDTMRVDCEFDQGYNVVKAAMTAGVKHIVYVGTPYCSLYAVEKCKYFMGKEKVEAHIVSCGLPYTILHLGFYYENFLSVFRPHLVDKDKFALALPMGNVALNCGSVLDFGQCIAKILLRPTKNIFKTIKLSTGYHTVEELARTLDDHFQDFTFYDPKIPLSVYRAFDFKGSQELASMFAYYQSVDEKWPHSVAQELHVSCRSFKDWIADEEGYLLEVMAENLESMCPPVRSEHSCKVPRLILPRLAYDTAIGRKLFQFFNRSPRISKQSKESEVDDRALKTGSSTSVKIKITSPQSTGAITSRQQSEVNTGFKLFKPSDSILKR